MFQKVQYHAAQLIKPVIRSSRESLELMVHRPSESTVNADKREDLLAFFTRGGYAHR